MGVKLGLSFCDKNMTSR